MSHTSVRITQRPAIVLIMVSLTLLAGGIRHGEAHQDPCHRFHSCPSDGHPYVCSDRGRCDQCPDNPYCLAGQSGPAASSPATPTPAMPMPGQPSSPGAMTVCFTPGGNCTALIVQALSEAKSSILVRAYRFTSVRHEAH